MDRSGRLPKECTTFPWQKKDFVIIYLLHSDPIHPAAAGGPTWEGAVIEDLWTQGNREIEAWRSAPLRDLVTHILERHHLAAREEMARLETLAEEAGLLLGEGNPGLLELRDEIARFCKEFRAHMAMEKGLQAHILLENQVLYRRVLEQE
jgi:iron-sulfur cluster repair protein YtfE (RIC family)